jgi:hypothetical protein
MEAQKKSKKTASEVKEDPEELFKIIEELGRGFEKAFELQINFFLVPMAVFTKRSIFQRV